MSGEDIVFIGTETGEFAETNIEDTRRFMLKAKEEYLAKKKTKTKQIQR